MLTRKMKDSGIEWIGDIPEDWMITSLQRLFFIQAGGDAKKEYYNSKRDKKYCYPVYTNSKDEHSVYAYTSNPIFPANCITVSGRGAIGKAFYRKTPFDAIIRLLVLKPKTKSISEFYTYFIDTVLVFNTGSSAVGQLSTIQIAPYKVAVPPIEEQQSIVNVLNKKTERISLIIKQTQQSITELKKYKQSLITEAVTKGLDPNVEMKDSGIEWVGKIPKHWSMSRIKNKFTLNKGLTITKSDLKDKGIPVINYGEIHSKYGFRFDTKIHPVKNVDEEYLTKNENSLIKKGDFIFADTSEDLDGSGNFTCYIGDTQCFAGSHTVILKPRKNINHLYFSYLFESLAFRAQIQEKVQGIKVFSITQGILKPLTLIIPTEQEQEQIVSYLDEQTSRIDKLIADKTKVIEELEEYKKSLIYEYVTGKKEV